MESFSVETTLSLADWQVYLRAYARRLQAGATSRTQAVYAVTAAAVVAPMIGLLHILHAPVHAGSLIAGVVIGVASVWIHARFVRRSYQPDADGTLLGPRTFTFDTTGIRIQRPHWSAFFDWPCCKEVEIWNDYVFIWMDRASAYMVPRRDLPAGMTLESAAERIRWFAQQEAAISSAAPEHVPPPLGGLEQESSQRGLPQRVGPLAQAFRLLLLRPARGEPTPPTDGAIAGFAAFSLALWLLLDRLSYGAGAQFTPYEAPAFAWYLLFGLLLVWVTSRVIRPRIDFRNILFLFVVAAPLVITAAFLQGGGAAPTLQEAAVAAIVIYLTAYVAGGLWKLTGRAQVPAIALLLLLAMVLIGLDPIIYPTPTLWMQPDPERENEIAIGRVQTEDLLVSQPARIDAALSKVTPTTAGTPGMYFVGFAGVGRQRVFAEEIKLAARRIADRYGSQNRTLLLLNDRRDTTSQPLASVSGLRLALKGVASRMNPDADVLFLALSSHGSAAPALSVSNGYLPLHDLTGADLAAALKESGIKWKVIVISACHAGAFIDALRSDSTIVLTAAAADRTSFGCSDDRDLTYFGEAFYRDALPGAATLREAFDRARADIASREQREGIKPSNPQGFFGSDLEKKLATFNSRN